MKISSFVIFLAFITLNVLGFSSVAHASGEHHTDCFFAKIAESACVFMYSGFVSVSHHLTSLQSSIQGILVSGGLNLLTLLLVFSIFLAATVFKDRQIFQSLKLVRDSDVYKPASNFLVELFSRGILNPKIYLA